jgi:hypothetical protein
MRLVFFLLIIFVSSACAFASADEPYTLFTSGPLSVCATPGSFDELVDWIKKVDTQSLKSLNDPVKKGDYRSPLGFIIRRSCFSGPRADKKEVIIKRYENMLGFMLQQVSRCYKLLGFPQIESIPSLLRVVELTCAARKGGDDAQSYTEPFQNFEWKPSNKIFGLTGYSANSLGRREIEINIDEGRDLSAPIENLSSLLLHELLHFTASMNRSWHDTWEQSHQEDGCENSLFEDRVYFLQAACFPQSGYGLRLYGKWKKTQIENGRSSWKVKSALLDCEGLCHKALGEVDSIESFMKAYPELRQIYKVGKMQIAKSMHKKTREILCGRTHQVATTRKQYQLAREDIVAFRYELRVKPYLDALTFKEGDGPSLKMRFQEYIDIINRPFPRAPKLKRLTELKGEIEKQVSELCYRKPDACEVNNEPFKSVLDRGYALVENLTSEQEKILEFSFGAAPELRH